MLSKEQKLNLAQLMFNDKEILFGDFGPNLTKVEKQRKWIEIFIKLNAMGANIPDYKTLRDIEWSNMRRGAEKKLLAIKMNDNRPQEEKLSIRQLAKVDEIVLDILGKGRGVTEAKEVVVPDVSNLSFFEMSRVKYEDYVDDYLGDDSLGGQNDESRSSESGFKRKKRQLVLDDTNGVSSSSDCDVSDLYRKRLRLEITKLELEIEKLPLECAALELHIQKLQRSLME